MKTRPNHSHRVPPCYRGNKAKAEPPRVCMFMRLCVCVCVVCLCLNFRWKKHKNSNTENQFVRYFRLSGSDRNTD